MSVELITSQIGTLEERIKISKQLLSKIDNLSDTDTNTMKKQINDCIVSFEVLNFLLMERQVIETKEEELNSVLSTVEEVEVPTQTVGLDGEIVEQFSVKYYRWFCFNRTYSVVSIRYDSIIVQSIKK